MNAFLNLFSERVSNHPLKEVKASGGYHETRMELIEDVSLKSSHPCDNS